MKLKSTADGLKAVDINNPDSTPLDLTKQMPGNTVFEGVEVWQFQGHDGQIWHTIKPEDVELPQTFEEWSDAIHNVHHWKARKAYQPLEVKEQVREEALKTKWKGARFLDTTIDFEDDNRTPYEEYIDAVIDIRKNSGDYEDDCVTRKTKASNPELGVEFENELVKASEKRFPYIDGDDGYGNYIVSSQRHGFLMGAKHVATQQQGLVSLDEVKVMAVHVGIPGYMVDKLLKTLKQ